MTGAEEAEEAESRAGAGRGCYRVATYTGDATRADALCTAYQSASESADKAHRLYVKGCESFIAVLDAMRTLDGVAAQVAIAEWQVAQGPGQPVSCARKRSSASTASLNIRSMTWCADSRA